MGRHLSEDQSKALLFYLHEQINSTAARIVEALAKGDVSKELIYPPGSTLTEQEYEALSAIMNIPGAYGALNKIMAEACWYPVYGLLQVVDGESEPGYAYWKGVSLLDQEISNDKPNDLTGGFLDTFDEWAVQCVGTKN